MVTKPAMALKAFSLLFAFVAFTIVSSSAAFASNWYASTGGSPSGNGSQAQPWDLCTAIGCSGAAPSSVQPGDTVWLTGGTYTPPGSPFIFHLNGTATAPIWVRNVKVPPAGYAGQLNPDGSERVILNGNGQNFPDLSGSYTVVEGLEFVDLTLQSGNRYLTKLCSGCPPSLYPPGASAIEVDGPGNRVVHCIAHDNAAGIYSYIKAPNAEIYGNISYYNGYMYGTQGLGHGYYMQNVTGNKWVTNNFAGDNVDNGFQIYGSGGSAIGFILSGNASYDNGSLAAWQYNLVVGSAAGTNANTFDSFYTFFPLATRNGYVTIGQYDPISNITYTNSVFVGGYSTVGSEGIGGPATFSGNKLVNVPSNSSGAPSTMVIFAQFSNQSKAGINWDNNQYYGGPNLFYSGAYDGNNLSNGAQQPFSSWQTSTGFDTHSTYTGSLPTGAWTYVLPDKYTTKRANIIVYNWNAYADQSGTVKNPCTGSCASVAVDLSAVLSPGDPFVIQDAQNWFGPHVLTGIYQGGTVSIPMSNLGPKPTPWGFSTAPQHTAPAYGTFVVFSANSTDVPGMVPVGPTSSNPIVGTSGTGGSSNSTSSSTTTGSSTGSTSSSSSTSTSGSTPSTPTGSSSTTGVSPTFAVGETVAISSVASPANVRSQGVVTASILGSESNGAIGKIVGGPNPIPAAGAASDILWDVQFSNLTGWIWQSLLVASNATPPTGATSGQTSPTTPSVSSVSLTPSAPSVQAGGNVQFAAAVNCTGGGCNQNVTWSASAGTVSSSGLFTAPAGTANVTVTVTSVQDGTKSASTTVSVTTASPSLVSVSVAPTTVNTAPGATQQFSAMGHYSDGSTADLTSAVTWNTSTPGVAAVNNSGMVSVQGVGSATITAGIMGSATLTGQSSVSSSTSAASTSLPGGLILHWTFDTSSISGNTVADSSGQNHTGMINGTPVGVAGKLGQAFQFNGANSSINTAGGAPFTGDLTLAAWIKTTNSSRIEGLISKYDAAGSGTGYILRTDSAGHLEVVFGGLNGGSVSTPALDTAVINDGQWHHVAAVITVNQSVQFYVDGNPTVHVPVSISPRDSTSYFTVGVNPYTGFGNYFTGTIDDVQAYNRALSPSEIGAVYSWTGN